MASVGILFLRAMIGKVVDIVTGEALSAADITSGFRLDVELFNDDREL